MMQAIIFGIASVAVVGFIIWKMRQEDEQPKNIWKVPFETLDRVMNELEPELIADGWGRADYVLHVKDCSKFAPEHKRRLERELSPLVPKGKVLYIRLLSFPRADGGGRHQVAEVPTDKGLIHIETYRINGSLYRDVSKEEIKAGYYLKEA